jgi:hypothetical protein
VEGSAHSQFEVLYWHLSGRIEENHEKSVRIAGLQTIIYEYGAHSNTVFNKFPYEAIHFARNCKSSWDTINYRIISQTHITHRTQKYFTSITINI